MHGVEKISVASVGAIHELPLLMVLANILVVALNVHPMKFLLSLSNIKIIIEQSSLTIDSYNFLDRTNGI